MKKIIFILMILSGALFSQSAKAAGTTYLWTGLALDGNWTSSLNWLPVGYPGQSGNSDVAIVDISLTTITLNTSLTISQLESTVFGITGITISTSGASTILNITNGVTTSQPLLFSIVLTFSGNGTTNISGTSALGYAGSMYITSGATVAFQPNSVLDFTGNQGTLGNAGILKFLSGSNFKIGYNAGLTNTGTVTSNGGKFTMSGSPCALTNGGTFNATSSTFTLSGSNIPIVNSGTFTTDKCTLTSNNSGCSFNNTGTYNDHGSNITFTGQNNTIKNTGAASVMNLQGVNITFSGSNNGHILSNAGIFTADSLSAINMSTYTSQIGNAGTFYAGISNSSCIINLNAQSSNISNTGTFNVGSTSGITMAGTTTAIVTSGTFTFQSDAFGTGYLGSVPSTSTITGTFNVQRYITGGSATYRGYRLFSSPVYAGTVSSNHVYSLNYVKNSALVTGSGGTAGGFDKNGNPSLYLYRENIAYSNSTYVSGNFRGVANIASAPGYTIDGDAGSYNLPAGNGFLFWFRGDRTSNLANKYKPGTLAESVTMTATGTLNVGQVIMHDWYTPASANLGYTITAGNTLTRGYNFAGNPYPSSIDWETMQTSSISTGIYSKNLIKTIYVLNPATQNYGAYMQGNSGVGTNGASNIIASGEGFFVRDTIGGTPQLIFNESAKSTSQTTGANLLMSASHTLALANNPYFRVKLVMDSINTDDILVKLDNNSSAKFSYSYDSPYLQGFGKINLAGITSDGTKISIGVIPFPKKSETLGLFVNAKSDGIYQLTLEQVNQIPRLYDIWLMDNYKKDSLDMRQNTTYAFNLYVADTTSYGPRRFSLVIRQNPAYTYQLLSFDASKVPGIPQVNVTWTTANEGNNTSFSVERRTSIDTTFIDIGDIAASGIGSYTFLDKAPAAGANYYRLKQSDSNGSITYSQVVEVLYSDISKNAAGTLMLYPNPAINSVNLTITPASATTTYAYNITISNSAGIVVKQAATGQGQWQGSVSDLLPGAYTIRVVNSKDKSLVGDTRFVKL